MSTSAEIRRRSAGWSIVVGALILALGGAAWWLVWDGRDSGAAASDADDVVLAVADEDDEAEEGGEFDFATIEVTYDFFLARDPFESIRPPEPVTADPTDPDPTDPDPTDPDPTDPTDPDEDACAVGAEAVCDGIVVDLLEANTAEATIQVDGVTYVVSPGDAFAQNFALLDIDGDCAEILYQNGDEAEVFTLCVGDTVAK